MMLVLGQGINAPQRSHVVPHNFRIKIDVFWSGIAYYINIVLSSPM